MVDFIEDNKIKLLFASEMEEGNFGDILSRYIVEKISGLEVSKYNYKNKINLYCSYSYKAIP